MLEIPQAYEEYLGPFLFEPFALDLVQRIGNNNDKAKHVLELACGTGRVTRHLLPHSVLLTATDINPDMLAIAREKIRADNILWDIVDMTNIYYQDDSFDLVICQFGLMLVPDKGKALAEIFRVLKKGGRLLFNVWGHFKDNQVWEIGMKVMRSFFSENLIPQNIGPFSMQDETQPGHERLHIKVIGKINYHEIYNTSNINFIFIGQP